MTVRERPLADCARWYSGGTPKTSVKEYWGGEIPWITSGSLTTFRLRDSQRKLTPLGVVSGSRLMPPGAVLFVVRGMSLNSEFRVGIAMRELAFGQDCKALIANDGILPEYLAYSIAGRSREVLGMVDQAAHGTGRLATDLIGSLPIRIAYEAEQRAIVRVLSALDDLIENDLRRVEVLEQMARLIYREWFVHFRCPGHNHDELVDAGRVPMPKGWTWLTLGEAATWLSGGTPSTREPSYWDGEIPWITSGSLTSFLLADSDRKLTPGGVSAGSRLVGRDTLLFVVRGMSLASEFRHGIADVALAFGQDCKALVANDGVDPLLLAFAVADRADEIQHMVEFAAHGTGKLSTDRVKAVTIPVPPPEVQAQFSATVRPMRELMSVLNRRSQILQQTRDLLLPRLVSGELDVSELDLDLEPMV